VSCQPGESQDQDDAENTSLARPKEPVRQDRREEAHQAAGQGRPATLQDALRENMEEDESAHRNEHEGVQGGGRGSQSLGEGHEYGSQGQGQDAQQKMGHSAETF
jgi:hypothetical protein